MINKLIKEDDFIDAMQLPRDVILGETVIELSGKHRLFVENYEKILDFSDELVKIKCKREIILILGKKLMLDYYSKNEAIIKGCIDEIKFQ